MEVKQASHSLLSCPICCQLPFPNKKGCHKRDREATPTSPYKSTPAHSLPVDRIKAWHFGPKTFKG